ncbi:MAG: hypothetical protein HRU21_04685 [Pseudomonadales bacterium]|nr:hypothetical protein [Pseudomonadales bacterium]
MPQDSIKVSDKVVKDLVRGLNPVTGQPHFEQAKDNTPLLKAVMRSFRVNSFQGNLVNLMQEVAADDQPLTLLSPVQQQYLIVDFRQGLGLKALVEAYAIPAQLVIAYLIEADQISAAQAAFFCASIQRRLGQQLAEPATVISLSAHRSRADYEAAKV